MFFVFWDSDVRCIYMNIQCTFHISVSWVWYIAFFYNSLFDTLRKKVFFENNNDNNDNQVPSLSSIVASRFFKLHSMPSTSSCWLVLANRPKQARPCEGVHRRPSLMSSSSLHEQCTTWLVPLTWMALEMSNE